MTLSETAAELIRIDPALAHEVARQLSPKPSRGLTRRQADALQFIRAFHDEGGLMPTYDEIRKGLGLTTKSRVFGLINGLEERGYITRLPGRARSIALNEVAP